MPRLAVLFVLSAASSLCPDLNLIHYILNNKELNLEERHDLERAVKILQDTHVILVCRRKMHTP
ncbi:hypothetical protein EGH14_11080 [Neisseria gonorrhoeae]|nr:hypothetical protein EGH14_11080 [Neisseria gonorrhoeae]AZG30607.1 hypothetical protein EGH20_11090 [Neisseria gonorrhoeae]